VPEGLDDLVALFAYEESGRRLVAGLKYRNRRGAVPWIARRLATHLAEHRAQAVTWVPASYRGRRQRGFDTGELLARNVAHELRLPALPLLRRKGAGVQSSGTRSGRLIGPSIEATRRARRGDIASVILIDDVCTTGTSLSRSAEQLRLHGVRFITGAVAARTPLHL
jgi:predicted amidophosphoribosyltransferase